MPCFSNNVRLNGTVKVTDVTSGVATLELDLAWDNSWRDNFNWDAVWIFLKYKAASGAWSHVMLQDVQHTATNDYVVMNGKNSDGNVVGVYVFPGKNMTKQHVTTKVTLKWACGGGYTKASFDNNQVFVLAQGIEMVYIPFGAYYLGDNYSNHTFASVSDLINQGTYTASSTYSGYPAQNALPGSSGYWCSAGQGSEEWWQIKFAQPQMISSFALGVYAQVQYGYLEGSNSGQSGDWETLWSGGSNCFPVSSASSFSSYYQVASPAAYSYYRIRMKSSSYSGIYALSLRKEESPFVIDSEDALTLSVKDGMSNVSLAASYPKGYAGFYVMKYETSQEQYVTFLNTLTRAQQETLLGGAFLAALSPGRYIFGDTLRPSFRNGIILSTKPEGQPYIFDNNLNENDVYGEDGDGQCIACNYMSLNDVLAYASWAGLRPMSELEYEGACRAPFPQDPMPGEYPWNNNSGVSTVTSIMAGGRETEVAGNVTCNVNSGNSLPVGSRGPVRCGLFARNSSTQLSAGATYWGVMEMAGNVRELVVAVSHTSLNRTANGSGAFNVTAWTNTPTLFGLRGGSFAGATSLLRTSDRTEMTAVTSVAGRDSTVGFRLTRTLGTGSVTINAGSISLNGPLCSDVEGIVSETAAASVSGIGGSLPISYTWSYSADNGSTWTLIPGVTANTLRYAAFEAGKTYLFRRTALCALGEASAQTSGVTIMAPTVINSITRTTDNACNTTFTISASGTALKYQWQENGNDITGATATTYKAGTDGLYRCIVTGSCGVETSDVQDANPIISGRDGVLVDSRDNKTYRTRIFEVIDQSGNKVNREWMIENLRFGTCNNSTFNTYWTTSAVNQIAAGYYGVCIASTVAGGGHLYNWQAAMNDPNAVYGTGGNPSGNVNGNSPNQWQGICPNGWHLPSGGSRGEFQELYTALNSTGNRINPGCLDFRGVLGGHGNGSSLYGPGSYGYYWSSTYSNTAEAYGLRFHNVNTLYSQYKHYGFAVRCVKNY